MIIYCSLGFSVTNAVQNFTAEFISHNVTSMLEPSLAHICCNATTSFKQCGKQVMILTEMVSMSPEINFYQDIGQYLQFNITHLADSLALNDSSIGFKSGE